MDCRSATPVPRTACRICRRFEGRQGKAQDTNVITSIIMNNYLHNGTHGKHAIRRTPARACRPFIGKTGRRASRPASLLRKAWSAPSPPRRKHVKPVPGCYRLYPASPCIERSSPMTSSSFSTRSPMVLSRTFSRMKLTTKEYTSATHTARAWIASSLGLP